MNRVDLAEIVDRELKRLGVPRAPDTLLPRVMAAVHQWAQRPWYTRAWFTWPLEWQVLSAAALILLLAGAAVLMPNAQAVVDRAASTIGSVSLVHDIARMAQRTEVAMNAARILWRALVEPVVPYTFALVMLMCLASAALGTALTRVAFGRAFQS